MKHTFKTLICTVLLLALLVSTLAGCKEPTMADKLNRMEENERTYALMGLIDENGEAADSYTFDLQMELSGKFMGVDMEVHAEGTQLYRKLSDGTLEWHSSTKTEMDAMNGGVSSVVRIEEGFQSDKMYRHYRGNGVEQKFWSPIEWADYKTYQDSNSTNMDFDFQPEDCGNVTCVQEEDGTWTVTMKDFTEAGLQVFAGLTNSMEEIFADEYAIEDIAITLKATEDFYLSAFTFDFALRALDEDYDGELPKMTVELAVGKYNETTIMPINFKEYTEVADLRVLNIPGEELKDFVEGEEGFVKFRIVQFSGIRSTSIEERSVEVDKISFTDKDGKYTYHIDVMQNGEGILMTYADGIKTVVTDPDTANEKTNRTESTDEDERAFIKGLLLQSEFDPNMVIDIEPHEKKENIYIFHVNAGDHPLLERVMKSVEAKNLSQGSAYYTATIVDGKLLKLELSIDAAITLSQGSLLDFELSLSYDFSEQ